MCSKRRLHGDGVQQGYEGQPELVRRVSGEWTLGLQGVAAADQGARQALGLGEIELGAVMEWIDEQRAAGELSDASIRHNMNLLSRFFSWAIARGKASINPVRQIPMGSRPTQTVKSDTPWLDDDTIVRKLINDLAEPIGFVFYLCNRSGLRTGEAAGLRMSDMAFVDEGGSHRSRRRTLAVSVLGTRTS